MRDTIAQMSTASKVKQRVCIIIPAYNEGKVIKAVIKKADKVMKKHLIDYEIVVINDASVDNTAAQARSAGATVITHILNTGAGGATSTGLRYARNNNFSIAATMDGDGQHDPEDVLKGIIKVSKGQVDLLIGSRLIETTGMPKIKVIGNKGLSLITRVLFNIKVTDSQSGLRIFSEKAIKDLAWKSNRYEFCSEMLWRANQKKLAVDEYTIKAIYTDYSKTKGQNNWNAVNIVKSLIARRIMELVS